MPESNPQLPLPAARAGARPGRLERHRGAHLALPRSRHARLDLGVRPALRRVRQTTPANRSDGFLGSDTSQDDGSSSMGRSKTSRGPSSARPISSASRKRRTSSEKRRRWVDGKGWTPNGPTSRSSASWTRAGRASHGPHRRRDLSQRRFWVVEGVPRDTYYLFGKIQLYIDRLGYQAPGTASSGWKGSCSRSIR